MKKQKEQKEQHPILNQVLTPEFLKQFKDSGELNSFMEQLYAREMEQMLEGDATKLKHAVKNYGTLKTQRLFMPALNSPHELSYAG